MDLLEDRFHQLKHAGLNQPPHNTFFTFETAKPQFCRFLSTIFYKIYPTLETFPFPAFELHFLFHRWYFLYPELKFFHKFRNSDLIQKLYKTAQSPLKYIFPH